MKRLLKGGCFFSSSKNDIKNNLMQLKCLSKDGQGLRYGQNKSISDNTKFDTATQVQSRPITNVNGISRISFLKRINSLLISPKFNKMVEKNFQRKNGMFIFEAKDKLSKNQGSQEVKYTQLRWIRHLLLILFMIKILQQENIRCEYDINDMMITIELEDRLLLEQQENEKHANEQKKKGVKKEQKRSTIQFKGPTKDQRYGTVEQMLKHQMDSHEEFRSVQQRIIFMQIEKNRNKEAQMMEKKPSIDESKQQRERKQENIADVVFRQQIQVKAESKNEQGNKEKALSDVDSVQEDNKETINKENVQQKAGEGKASFGQSQKDVRSLNEMPDRVTVRVQKIPTETNLSQQKEQKSSIQEGDVNNGREAPKQLTENSQLKQKSSIESESIERQDQNIPLRLKQQNKQNHATITVSSEGLVSLSHKIKSFLKLRGISVQVQNISNPSSSENSGKQRIKLNLCNKLLDCRQIDVEKSLPQDRDVFHHINNFLNPPHVVNSIQEAQELLKLIERDENIVASYIPSMGDGQSGAEISQFDTFSLRYPKTGPQTAEKLFRQYKYLSSSKKNCFVIVRNKQVADFLKISPSKVGVPYVFYKYDKELNGRQSEPNCKINGEFYHVIGNLDKIIQKQQLNTVQKVAHKINTLTERGFTLINSVEDLYDKIRQLRQQSVGFSFSDQSSGIIKPRKKLFVIKINDLKSEGQINNILQKLSKMNKNQVSIVKTQSQLLLKSLGVFPNDQYGTIRVFDLQHKKQPIVHQQKNGQTEGHFQRYVPNVPFQVESLSRWISNLTPFDKPYSEYDRSVSNLRASHPGDFEITSEEGKVKLVLFYKQGCRGCKMMDDLLNRVNEVKKELQSVQSQAARRQICLKYRIEDPQHLRNIEISKFNILNDDQSIEVPQTTPTVWLLNGTNREKVVLKTEQLFNHLNRINTNNGEVVQDFMVRDLIEEIEKGQRRLEAIY